MSSPRDLIEYLIHHNCLSSSRAQTLKDFLDRTPEANIVELIVRGGFIESNNLARIEAEFFNLPYFYDARELDSNIVNILPFELARDTGAICYGKSGNVLDIAFILPEVLSIRRLNAWAADKGFYLNYSVCSLDLYEAGLKLYPKAEDVDSEESQALKKEELAIAIPIDRILKTILSQAIKTSASEVVFEKDKEVLSVKFRINGILMSALSLPVNLGHELFNLLRGLGQVSWQKKIVQSDFELIIDAQNRFFRITFLPTGHGEKAVLTILSNADDELLDFQGLGYSQEIRDLLDRSLAEKSGKTILACPSGHGRTTSYYSILNQLDVDKKNVISLEKSLEKKLPHVSQIVVSYDNGLEYSKALHLLNRHQPDLIAIDLLNNPKMAEDMAHIALAGGKIFTTIEANSVEDALLKLLKLKIEPYVLANILNGIFAQKLVRRVCPKCAETYEILGEDYDLLRSELKAVRSKLPRGIDVDGRLFGQNGGGCSWCDYSGYQGKIPVVEGVYFDDKLKASLALIETSRELKELLAKTQYISSLQDGLIKVLQGKTTFEEVVSKTP